MLTQQTIRISGIPFPPSMNASYRAQRVSPRSDKYRIGATDDLRAFKIRCNLFSIKYKKQLSLYKPSLQNSVNNGYDLLIDRYFIGKRMLWLRKDGRLKQSDVTNRIKALDDAVARMIGIDDKYILSGSETKFIASDCNPCVTVEITPVKMDMMISPEMTRPAVTEVACPIMSRVRNVS